MSSTPPKSPNPLSRLHLANIEENTNCKLITIERPSSLDLSFTSTSLDLSDLSIPPTPLYEENVPLFGIHETVKQDSDLKVPEKTCESSTDNHKVDNNGNSPDSISLNCYLKTKRLDANQNLTLDDSTKLSTQPKCLELSPKAAQNSFPIIYSPSASSSKPKTLMEALLMAKMEQAALGHPSRQLVRTDSADSNSSFGSLNSAIISDVCRCDDCLLGIGDLWQPDAGEEKKKKPSGWRKLRNIVQWTPFFQTYKKQRYPWVQLAGHQGNFKAGPDQGTILKKLCAKEEKCFKILMKDVLRPYVPEYKGLVQSDEGECSYIQLQDLLGDFVSPCVMDCKIGVRTYLEEELAKAKEKPKLRKDMYEKMCQIDQNAPTDEEHKLKGVTKPRYMVWRETISSTATLGFRIEGIRNADGTSTKDFKTTKTKEQVIGAFEKFTDGFPHAIPKYIQRLKAIRATLETSNFFSSHEVIGSSLLFVHDRYDANVWLIDFAKTIVLPDNIKINHSSKWKVGNHEDGYLIGVGNLIKIFMTMLEQQPVTISPPLALQDPPEVTQESVEKT